MRKKISVIIVMLVFVSIFQGIKVQANSVSWNFLKLNNCSINSSKLVDQTKRYTFYFKKDEIASITTDDGVVYSMPGCSQSTAPEKPNFPIWKQKFPIQESCQISYIRTICVDGCEIDDSDSPIATTLEPMKYSQRKVTPSEGNAIYSKSISDQPSENQYQTSVLPSEVQSIYPEVNVTGKISSYNHQTDLSLSVYPIYVLDGCVYLVTKITVEIGFLDEKNPSNLDEKENSSIILAPDEFKDVAEKLARIQEKEGFETEIILISFVEKFQEADYPDLFTWGYTDEHTFGFLKRYNYSLSAKIRKMLELRLKKDKVDYLTILGDASWVPPSFYYDASERYSYVDTMVPTDFYYMAPFAAYKTMNFEISVGRIPVQTLEDAVKAVDKIERYHSVVKTSDEDWKTTLSMFSGDPFRGDYFGELSQCSAINKDILNGMTLKKYFRTSDQFTAENCKKELYSGDNRILWITGHGSGNEILFSSERLCTEDVLKAPKKSKLPIIISESCLNGTWDSRLIDGAEKTPLLSFAESIFRSEGAGIAYIGGARSNYSHVNVKYDNGKPELINQTYINSVVEYTLDYSIRTPESTLGDSVKKALYQYYTKDIQVDREGHFYRPDIKALFGYCLLGDPTLPCIKKDQSKTYKVPDIKNPHGTHESPDYLPIFAIDDGVYINVDSDSSTLKYSYCLYDNNDQQLLSYGSLDQASSDLFSKKFTNLVKSKGCMRFETEDYKESRIVGHSKYFSDLRIEKTTGIQVLRVGENVRHSIQVFNDGIFESRGFKISVLKNGELETEKTFRTLPFDSFMSYDFYIESPTAEDFQIEIKIDLLEKKTLATTVYFTIFMLRKNHFAV